VPTYSFISSEDFFADTEHESGLITSYPTDYVPTQTQPSDYDLSQDLCGEACVQFDVSVDNVCGFTVSFSNMSETRKGQSSSVKQGVTASGSRVASTLKSASFLSKSLSFGISLGVSSDYENANMSTIKTVDTFGIRAQSMIPAQPSQQFCDYSLRPFMYYTPRGLLRLSWIVSYPALGPEGNCWSSVMGPTPLLGFILPYWAGALGQCFWNATQKSYCLMMPSMNHAPDYITNDPVNTTIRVHNFSPTPLTTPVNVTLMIETTPPILIRQAVSSISAFNYTDLTYTWQPPANVTAQILIMAMVNSTSGLVQPMHGQGTPAQALARARSRTFPP
jgi:hypothetical protein